MNRANQPQSARATRDDIAAAAARWLARRDANGALPPEEAAGLAAWLSADPRHAEAFAQQSACWAELDRLETFRPAPAGTPIADLPLRPRRPRLRSAVRRFAPLAAAAVLALSATWYWQTTTRPYQETAQTAVGAVRTLELPDGSSIVLNTDSVLQVDMNRDRREVALIRGEAFFTVASDPNRPFVVKAGAVRVQAVGTAFNVRRHAADVEVLVAHGLVKVDDSEARRSLLPVTTASEGEPLLAAGQRAVVHPEQAGRVETVSQTEISRRLAWQERRLEFGPTPLREIIAEFNRYSARPLAIEDPALGALTVGGSFRAGDEETLVRFLEANFPIESVREAQVTRLRPRP